MRRKVLIGFDGTPRGEDAAWLGREFAGALDAVALVATVIRHPRHGVDSGDYEQAVSDYCREAFATARRRLEGVDVVERPLVHDSRSAAIYQLVEWDKPSLVVIGSSSHSTAGRILLGSLGSALLSGAPCAVAVAPLGYSEQERRLERIGVAIDGSSEAWHALQAGAVLARRTGAPLRLLSVMDRPHYALGGLLSPLSPEEYRAYKEREAETVFTAARERLSPEIEVETMLLHGTPAEELAAAAQDLDLLAVGSRGHGPVKGTLLGSVSAKLLGAASCPVMVLPRGTPSHPLEP